MLLALARHTFEHGVGGRFYTRAQKYHHEGGKVDWCMGHRDAWRLHPHRRRRLRQYLQPTIRLRGACPTDDPVGLCCIVSLPGCQGEAAGKPETTCANSNTGAPGRTRTCDPRLRRPVLYPAELRALGAIVAGARGNRAALARTGKAEATMTSRRCSTLATGAATRVATGTRATIRRCRTGSTCRRAPPRRRPATSSHVAPVRPDQPRRTPETDLPPVSRRC